MFCTRVCPHLWLFTLSNVQQIPLLYFFRYFKIIRDWQNLSVCFVHEWAHLWLFTLANVQQIPLLYFFRYFQIIRDWLYLNVCFVHACAHIFGCLPFKKTNQIFLKFDYIYLIINYSLGCKYLYQITCFWRSVISILRYDVVKCRLMGFVKGGRGMNVMTRCRVVTAWQGCQSPDHSNSEPSH